MDAESVILSLINSRNNGIPETEAQKLACETLSRSEWHDGLQNLLSSHAIIRESTDFTPFLRVATTSYADLRLSGQQLMVYRVIDMVGQRGITEDELVKKLHGKNFPIKKDIKKSLKSLLEAQHVRTIQSIRNRKEVLYFAAGVEPTASLTGGRWYTKDKDFDSSYVDQIRKSCLRFSRDHPNDHVTSQKVYQWLTTKGKESTIAPDVEDIAQVLFTLELDGVLRIVGDHIRSSSLTKSKDRSRSPIEREYTLAKQVASP
eukprot:CAMPEP_0201529416 /NCGR_PEP_ID=MMETSP0161_2-20130828/41650_1 /ASSEMBLY_ACC=CAM_ASM_000251 /TAXON_ID=180227 /ORGANISM="Neoparamoeba aestuarina, Strain SoJaBio B1-5/56/2" /LENGTH=259 /DNA_ID=CAMNT_0047931205 /DNA_START=25 /DNA_END=800 /DNA_ORIENTATION=-